MKPFLFYIIFLCAGFSFAISAKKPVLLIPGVTGTVLKLDIPGTSKIQVPWVGGFSLYLIEKSSLPKNTSYRFCRWIGDDKKLGLCVEYSGGDAHFRTSLLGHYNPISGLIDPAFAPKGQSPVTPLMDNDCHPFHFKKNVAPINLCGFESLVTPLKRSYAGYFEELALALLRKNLGDFAEYFGPMVTRLTEKEGYQIGQDLFGFPYDWRLSNLDNADKLAERVQDICEKSRQPVTLVAHSMGNILVMAFLGKYPQLGHRCVEKWVAIAPPFQGTPAALVTLTKGYDLGDLMPCAGTTRPSALQSPAAFELLPNPDFDWKGLSTPRNGESRFLQDPFIAYEKALGPSLSREVLFDQYDETLDTLSYAFENNAVCEKPHGKKSIFPLSESARAKGEQLRALLKTLDKNSLPPVHIAYGYGLDTPYGIRLTQPAKNFHQAMERCGLNNCAADTQCIWPECHVKHRARCKFEITHADGDGTLVTSSATHTPFSPFNHRVSLTGFKHIEHTKMVKETAVLNWLAHILKAKSNP